ncbi:MAG: zinc-binding dehydrogenase [Acidobacteriota bacterium]|nr:zinc-binding dehydrogenase [Acidobacteriota bacterium]
MIYRRIVVNRSGGPEVLEVAQEELREPGPGEVRVRVIAAGVAFADILMREGAYPGGPAPPFTPGYDLIGVVDAVGEGVSSVRPGQMVTALTVFGCYTEVAYLPETELVVVPEGLDAIEALALVLNYVSAWQILHRVARVRRGERVLVHSAAGGFGTAALELSRMAGLVTFGTASAGKLHLVQELGAVPIDYRKEDFLARIRDEGGVDVVLDGIGGAVSVRSYRALRRGGRLVIFGLQSAVVGGRRSLSQLLRFYTSSAALLLARLLPDGRRALPYRVAVLKRRHPDWFREDLEKLFGLLAANEIRPVIAERIPLMEARRAHELLVSGSVSGKIVLIT